MFCIGIAGKTIGIQNKYESVFMLCRDYICEGKSDILVSVSEAEIDDEIKNYGEPVSRGYAESVCIYRQICEELPEHGAFLLHSAVVECDGVSYAFSAPSGTGKSTHAALWLAHFGERARIINGDKPLIFFDGDCVYACGTPWCGKEGQNTNAISQLRAICFIERGDNNEICRIDTTEAVTRLLTQIIVPKKERAIDRMFDLLDRMLSTLPCYLLRCTVSDEAVVVAYDKMSEEF